MHEFENPAEGSGGSTEGVPPRQHAAESVAVSVVRTGGIAGLRRRWRVEPSPSDAPQWIVLVDSCPWDEPLPHDAPGADRYVWSIHVQLDEAEREREIPEGLLEGPWRDLVDAVRDADDRNRKRSEGNDAEDRS